MQKAIFFHAGCPVCVSAEQSIIDLVDSRKVNVEVVHLGNQPQKVQQAESMGVKSVPALVLDGNVLHINFGADIQALKK
jgi:glutaredoxin 3